MVHVPQLTDTERILDRLSDEATALQDSIEVVGADVSNIQHEQIPYLFDFDREIIDGVSATRNSVNGVSDQLETARQELTEGQEDLVDGQSKMLDILRAILNKLGIRVRKLGTPSNMEP